MDERSARLLALMCSVLGVALLYLSSSWLEQMSAAESISGLGLDRTGSFVKVCGNIAEKKENGGNLFFRVSDNTGEIMAVVFKATAARLNRSTGIYNMGVSDSACFFGSINEYPPGSGGIELLVKNVVL